MAGAGARWRREEAERLRRTRRRTGDQGPVLTATSPGEDSHSTGQAPDMGIRGSVTIIKVDNVNN